MNDAQSEQCVRTFLDAFYAGDAARAQDCCDDAFSSIVYAPVEVFPHLGIKQGKAWVADAIRIQQEYYSSRRYTLEFIAAKDTRAATLVQTTLIKRSDDRVILLNVGEFFTLRAGRIVEHRALFDSFDLMQQLLGRDLTDEFAVSVRSAMRH
jgi:hypothetical protein